MDDIQLGVAIKRGNKIAFRSFFQKYYKLLMAYLTTFINDRDVVEDIAQQSFVILWEKKHLLDTTKSPKHYLFTIAQNQHKKLFKEQRKRDVFFENLKTSILNNDINEDVEHLESKLKELKVIIETLPPKCKEILILNKFEGLKYRQIAKHLNISIKTVESQMQIAYKKIREGFKAKNIFLSIWFYAKNVNLTTSKIMR